MLKVGKIPPDILKSSVFPYIGTLREEVLVHSGLGEDCSIIDFGNSVAVLSTDPITGADNRSSHLSVYVSCNDIAACGAKPVGVLVTLLLPPGSNKIVLKDLMKGIHEAANNIGIEVLGGHSEITSAVNKPVISATAIGITSKDTFVTSSGAKPGDDVLVTKALGLEGTAILASDYKEYLSGRVSKNVIDKAQEFIQNISVINEGIIASNIGVSAMHDITEGGLLGACYEVAEASGVGMSIFRDSLPILPETLDICQAFDINPLGLISSGSMLICTPIGDKVLEALKTQGIPATNIGKVINSGKFIFSQEGQEQIIPFERDELFKAIEKVPKI
ncbi:MAG: AIR synthase family protein [Tepidanaerobacteraceae bacterium]|nr:AIR synthase family protein [Tepidanaerobacteraceae bacterium]